MSSVLVAMFDSRSSAARARGLLIDAGYSVDDVVASGLAGGSGQAVEGSAEGTVGVRVTTTGSGHAEEAQAILRHCGALEVRAGAQPADMSSGSDVAARADAEPHQGHRGVVEGEAFGAPPEPPENDPLSGGMHVHPLGTGLGAFAGSLATGAAAGSVIGPVGTVIGAVAGAIAGAVAGKTVAERVNPTSEDEERDQGS